jgi:hypothetical protein
VSSWSYEWRIGIGLSLAKREAAYLLDRKIARARHRVHKKVERNELFVLVENLRNGGSREEGIE